MLSYRPPHEEQRKKWEQAYEAQKKKLEQAQAAEQAIFEKSRLPVLLSTLTPVRNESFLSFGDYTIEVPLSLPHDAGVWQLYKKATDCFGETLVPDLNPMLEKVVLQRCGKKVRLETGERIVKIEMSMANFVKWVLISSDTTSERVYADLWLRYLVHYVSPDGRDVNEFRGSIDRVGPGLVGDAVSEEDEEGHCTKRRKVDQFEHELATFKRVITNTSDMPDKAKKIALAVLEEAQAYHAQNGENLCRYGTVMSECIDNTRKWAKNRVFGCLNESMCGSLYQYFVVTLDGRANERGHELPWHVQLAEAQTPCDVLPTIVKGRFHVNVCDLEDLLRNMQPGKLESTTVVLSMVTDRYDGDSGRLGDTMSEHLSLFEGEHQTLQVDCKEVSSKHIVIKKISDIFTFETNDE